MIDNRFIIRQSEKQLKLVQLQVGQTEEQIETTIKEDDQLQKSLKLLCSIPGIGLVTAVALILATNNFTGRRSLPLAIVASLLPIVGRAAGRSLPLNTHRAVVFKGKPKQVI